MLRKLRPRRPSHATVVAYLALFVALGGSAAAAFVVSSNSQIGPDTIYGSNPGAGKNDNVVNGSLTGADVRGNASPGFINGSLDTYDIRDKGLLGGDLAADTVTAGQLAPNSVSTSEIKDGSVTNAKLAPGNVPSATTADQLDTFAYRSTTLTNPEGTQSGTSVNCPSGYNVVGGGVHAMGGFDDKQEVNSSQPFGTDAWIAFVDNQLGKSGGASDSGDRDITIYAICAKARTIDAG